LTSFSTDQGSVLKHPGSLDDPAKSKLFNRRLADLTVELRVAAETNPRKKSW
jgi:hypothetical protein